MMYLKALITLFTILFLTGCATPPQSAPRYAQAEIGKPDEERAVVVIYRQYVPPLAYNVTAKINDKEVASLPNNSFTWAYLNKGEHEIDISWPLLALTPGENHKLSVQAGAYYYIEFAGHMEMAWVGGAVPYGVTNMQAIDSSKAQSILSACCQYISVGL